MSLIIVGHESVTCSALFHYLDSIEGRGIIIVSAAPPKTDINNFNLEKLKEDMNVFPIHMSLDTLCYEPIVLVSKKQKKEFKPHQLSHYRHQVKNNFLQTRHTPTNRGK